MTRRILVTFGTLLSVCHADAQTADSVRPNMQNPYERTQEVMRRLNLPPDPAFKAKVDEAFALRNICFEKAMRPLVKVGLKATELAEAACRACDQQVVAAAKISFEANKHRYLEPNLESQIKDDQRNCPTYAFSLALEAPLRMEHEDSKRPPEQTSAIAHYGEWELTEEISFEKRISYRAVLPDRRDKSRNIQLTCSPSKRTFTLLLFDGNIKNEKPQPFLVTFNNSRLGTIDQFETTGNEGHVDMLPLFLELVGCGRCNPHTAPHDGPLFLAIQDRKMEFQPSGIRELWDEIARRCHL